MFDWIKSKGSKNRKDYGSFKFCLKSQPDVIDSSSTIGLIAYTNGFGNATIPCVYRWSIIKNGVKIERPQFKGSTYKCQPSDVGGVIQSQVISTDMQYGGTAIVQFDPVRIDPNIKSQVEQVLASGCFSTTVHMIKGIEERECQIKISEQSVKIKHNYSNANFTFEYSIFEPEIQCLIKNSTNILVHLKDKSQNQMRNFVNALFDDPFKNIPSSSQTKLPACKDSQIKNEPNNLQLKFPTHAERDIFLFIWKGFTANKQLKKSPTINNNKLPQKCLINQQSFDYLLEIQGLKKQLNRMSQVLKSSQMQKAKYGQEIQKLKVEIKSIVKNYTNFIEEKFHQRTQYKNNSILSIGEDSLSTKRYKNLQNQNNHLNTRIYALTKQIDTIRFQPLKIQSLRQSVHQQPVERLANSTNMNVNDNFVKSMNGSPFSKKKTTDQSQQFVNLLDDFEASRISYLSEISSIHENAPHSYQQVKQIDMQKNQLQKQLQRSYKTIGSLEQQLWRTREELKTKTHKVSQSVVNFNYNNLNESVRDIELNHNNKTQNENVSKKIALNDLKQIKKNIQSSKTHIRNLNDQFDRAQQYKNQEQRSMIRSNSVFHLNNSVSMIKTEKKQPCFNEEGNSIISSHQVNNQSNGSKLQLLNQQLLREKQALMKQNQILIQQNKHLSVQVQTLRKSQSYVKKLQTKIQSLQSQVQLYQKNLDVMNRSQQLSIDSNSFNDEQIQILKKQNDFLTNQNEKLTKACQKYMNEAKQSNKLRLQITKMRSRIISEKLY